MPGLKLIHFTNRGPRSESLYFVSICWRVCLYLVLVYSFSYEEDQQEVHIFLLFLRSDTTESHIAILTYILNYILIINNIKTACALRITPPPPPPPHTHTHTHTPSPTQKASDATWTNVDLL